MYTIHQAVLCESKKAGEEMKKNPLERLAQTHPGLEIWWDSSPLIYSAWSEELLKKASPDRVDEIQKQLKRFYDPKYPESAFFRGVTTNPPLSLQVIKMREPLVTGITDTLIENNPGIDKESLFWMTYKEIVRQGAEMYLGVFYGSQYRYGYLSGQVDPRVLTDKGKMIFQALELAGLSPNVMIKVPGSKQGYEVIKFLTSKGISTNNTLTFTLSQLMACAEAVKEGLKIAKRSGVDLARWRSVITYMAARYGDLGGLKKEAGQVGIELTEADVRWAELAIFKKAYRLVKERNYPSKMLMCSMRISPLINGTKHCWHLEKLAGGDIIFTCPPPFIEGAMETLDKTEFQPQIEEEIPDVVLEKLLRVPYFERAYREDGYAPEEFNGHPALVATAGEFSRATQVMVDFVAKRLSVK